MKGSEHPPTAALEKYSQGELSQIARAQVFQHVQGCQTCRTAIEELSAAPPSPDLAEGERPTAAAAAHDPMIGRMLGEYRVLEPIGQGGMGVLYKGEQPLIGKQVAIKVVLKNTAQDDEALQRMVEEARAVNAVRHPNIVDIFSFGFLADGRPYLVMELLEGQSLAELQKERGPLTAGQAAAVLDQVMAALEAAHHKGLIHRDLKPENIFVHARPDGWRVKVLDFGLAFRAGAVDDRAEGPIPDAGVDPRLTRPGVVMGTPLYMAPEQARGGKVTDRTDIYAMGAVAWSMLTGQVLFGGGTTLEVLQRHVKSSPPAVRALAPETPPALEALVLRMLDKDPLRRPGAAEVRRELAAQQQAATAQVAPLRAERRRGFLPIAGLVLAAVGLGGGTWVVLEQESARQEQEAIARKPIPPTPQPPVPRPPDPAPPPPPVAEAADAGPLAAPPAIPSPPPPVQGLSLRCDRITDIGPVLESVTGGHWFFALSMADEPQMLIASPGKKGKATAQRTHKALTACRGTTARFVASQVGNHGTWATRQGALFAAGPLVDASNVTIVKEPAPPKK